MFPVFVSQNLSPFQCCKLPIKRQKELTLYDNKQSKPEPVIKIQKNKDIKQIIKLNNYYKNTRDKYKVIIKSQYEKYLDKCERLHEMFTDPQFPPNSLSLGQISEVSGQNKVVWRRVSQMMHFPTVYQKDSYVSSERLQRCNSRDTYFLPSFSVLLSNHEIIEDMFDRNEQFSNFGIYRLIVNDEGYPREIVIDDYIPVYENTKKPVFTNALKNQIWMVLAEKAWAKIKGSYERILDGTANQVLRTFSMSPVIDYQNQIIEDSQHSLQNWETLKQNCQKYPICCTKIKSNDKKISTGDQSLNRLQIFEVCQSFQKQGQKYVVIKDSLLRNQSSKYEDFNNVKQGFIMKYKTFLKDFKSFTICYYLQKAHFDFQQSQNDNRRPKYYNLNIQQQTQIFVNLHRISRRYSRASFLRMSNIQKTIRQLVDIKGGWLKIIIAKNQSSDMNEPSYKYIDSKLQTNLNHITLKLTLQQGVYTVYTEGYSEEQDNQQYVFSIFSQKRAQIKPIVANSIEYKYFLEEVMLNHCLTSKIHKNYLGDQQTWYSSNLLYENGGFGYVLAFLSPKSQKSLKMCYNKKKISQQGYRVECKKCKNYQRIIKPGQADIIVFSLDYPAKKYMQAIEFPPKNLRIEVIM